MVSKRVHSTKTDEKASRSFWLGFLLVTIVTTHRYLAYTDQVYVIWHTDNSRAYSDAVIKRAETLQW